MLFLCCFELVLSEIPSKNANNFSAELCWDAFSFVIKILSYVLCVIYITERKRRVYDQYGKEGLNRGSSRRAPQDDDYDFYPGFPFTFRDPEDVFREFFGGTPFVDLFSGECIS